MMLLLTAQVIYLYLYKSRRIGSYAPPKHTNGFSGNSAQVLYQNEPSSGNSKTKY